MSSNQVQIKYMVIQLKTWNEKLGGGKAKRAMANSQFDFLQQEFLTKRHQIQKLQDQKEEEGLTTKNAGIGVQIREGVDELKSLFGKLKEEQRRLAKKKKDTPIILEKKKKIVENCEGLLADIIERAQGGDGDRGNNVQTYTDMKARLLADIEVNNDQIHRADSDGLLSEGINSQQEREMKEFKRKDEQQDEILDDIIDGLQNVRGEVKKINDKQDEVIDKTKKNKKKVDKVSKRIETDNDKLKKILKHFGRNRCCMFIVLLLLIIGLVVVIIKMTM